MSDANTIYPKVIARLYVNTRFGKGIGNKRINRFIFNGAIEFPDTNTKFWVDLPEFEFAKTSCSITDYQWLSGYARAHIKQVWRADPYEPERFLFGQLFDLKPKSWVDGFLLYDVDRANSLVVVFDPEHSNTTDNAHSVIVHETFPITPVHKQSEGRAPDFFGSNFDLEVELPNSSVLDQNVQTNTVSDSSALMEKVRSQINA